MSCIKLNYHGKRLLSLIVITIFLVVLLFKDNNKPIPENSIIKKENYDIKIDYPNIKNKEMGKIMNDYINDKKEDFINTVKDLGDEFVYEFSATYSLSAVRDITGVHIIIYSFTGGNHYIREDKSYYYKEETGEQVDLTYFLKDDSSLETLSNLAYTYIIKYMSDNKMSYNKDIIKSGTAKKISNFEHIVFKDEGLEILFPPYQVSSWSDGEIRIIIPYNKLKDVIKSVYLKENEVEEKSNITVSKKRDLEQFKNKKLIAFTFDDGPSYEPTTKLLKNLDKYNARVTFFVLGSRVNQYKSSLLKAYKQGNQIGSHTYSHLNLFKLKEIDVLKEVLNTNQAIKEVIGVEPTLLRPPYGNINDDIKRLTDMYTVLWSIDTEDWKSKDKNKIAKEIVNNAFDGAIVLLHDIYETSIDGALLAMEKLEKEGYAFVTIDEMAELRNINLSKKDTYYKIK